MKLFYDAKSLSITREKILFKRLGMLFCCFLSMTHLSYAMTTAPGVSPHSNAFLGSVVAGHVTTLLGSDLGSSVGVEGGSRQNRAHVTLGWLVTDNQRIKFTGEYLWQNIDYNFYSGTVRHWVKQGAIGAGYHYSLYHNLVSDLHLAGYYSHAPSLALSASSGNYTEAGSLYYYTDLKRLAGSNAAGISPGFAVRPWAGAALALSANYDHVHYATQYRPAFTLFGLGGTVDFTQAFADHWQLAASAASRVAFNHYQAGMNWYQAFNAGLLTVGLLGGYDQGKHTLPNTAVVSLNIGYAFAQDNPPANHLADADTVLTTWLAEPAVHMPQVLAIADEAVTVVSPIHSSPACAVPLFIGTIDSPQFIASGAPFSLATASLFTGTAPLYFSAVNLPPGTNIDAATGLISGIPGGSAAGIIVTATNSCGSINSNSFAITLT
jgi:hypothetical protein